MKNHWIRQNKQVMIEALITHLLSELRGIFNRITHITQSGSYSNWNLSDFDLYLMSLSNAKFGSKGAYGKFRNTELGRDVISGFAFTCYTIKAKHYNQLQTATDIVNQKAFDIAFNVTDLFFSGMDEEEVDLWTINYFQVICA